MYGTVKLVQTGLPREGSVLLAPLFLFFYVFLSLFFYYVFLSLLFYLFIYYFLRVAGHTDRQTDGHVLPGLHTVVSAHCVRN